MKGNNMINFFLSWILLVTCGECFEDDWLAGPAECCVNLGRTEECCGGGETWVEWESSIGSVSFRT